MAIRAFIFDMDGTVLHTLPDLVLAANDALSRMGFPPRTYEEIRNLMGNGAAHLVEMACPPGTPPEVSTQTFTLWRSIYLKSAYANTEPFPGVIETLQELRSRGVRTGILSNKFDAGVQALCQRFFPGLFDAAAGEVPPTPRKPDPTSLLRMLDALGVAPAETVYVGDTNIDVKTARNAGVRIAGVSWGYAAANPLRPAELDAFIHHPAELLALV